jgi:hypothetical protein
MRKILVLLFSLALCGAVFAGNAITVTAGQNVNSNPVVGAPGPTMIQYLPWDGEQGSDDLGVDFDTSHDAENPYNPEYYVYIDNEGLSGMIEPTYNWRDISDGTELGLAGDDQAVAVTLPGTFTFYDNDDLDSGGDYDTIYVSTNGLVGFESQYYSSGNYDDYANRLLPDLYGDQHSFIAAFWDDLVMLDNSHIYTKSEGNDFIISWVDLGIRGYEDLVDGTVSFQLILDYDDYSYTINLQDISVPGTGHDKGGSATIGVEDKHGMAGTYWLYNNPTKLDDEACAAFIVWQAPSDFDMYHPSGKDYSGGDIDENYPDTVTQGDIYELDWDDSANNNPYGPVDVGYVVKIFNDSDGPLLGGDPNPGHGRIDEGDNEEEIISYEMTTAYYNLDTSTIEVNESGFPYYQIIVLADDGWGRTEATYVNSDQPSGDNLRHYTFELVEALAAPGTDAVVPTSWGAIKAVD